MMAQTDGWTYRCLRPFGLELSSAPAGRDLSAVPAQFLKELIEKHRVLVIRGVASLIGEDALQGFCRSLGELLEWDFGAVNDLTVVPGAKNYLYTNHAVPFHWDGAFLGRIPHYIFFLCESAPPPGTGGETLFCDTTLLLQHSTAEQREAWGRITITYSTEKVVHYGGTFNSPMIARHPATGETVLRYAEPVEDLNPVRLEVFGVRPEAMEDFLKDMRVRLNHSDNCYQHCWQSGDIVIADNHSLLHGRNAFADQAKRHIRRVNIM